MAKTGYDILREVSVLTTDKHMEDIMRELEHCDDMLYNENLSAANYIYWKARKDTLVEMRDSYSNWLNSKE